MDKELYIKRRNLKKEIIKITITITTLTSFLKENEKFFKNKNSLKALKNIKIYLENTNQKLKNLNEKYIKIQKLMKNTCKHEIIFIDDYKNLECPICGLPVLENNLQNTKLILKVPLPNLITQNYKEKIEETLEHTPINLIEQTLETEIKENKIKVLKRKYK